MIKLEARTQNSNLRGNEKGRIFLPSSSCIEDDEKQ